MAGWHYRYWTRLIVGHIPLFSSREARAVGGASAFLFCPPRIPLPHVQPVSPAVFRALTARLATTRKAVGQPTVDAFDGSRKLINV